MTKGLSTQWPAATGRTGRASQRPGAVWAENTVSRSCAALREQHHPLLPTQRSRPEGSAASHGGQLFRGQEGGHAVCKRDLDLCVCVCVSFFTKKKNLKIDVAEQMCQ